MKVKDIMFRKVAIVLSVLISLTAFSSAGAKLKEDSKVIKISKKDAISRASESNTSMKRIDAGLDTIMRKLKEANDVSDSIKKLEDSLTIFKLLSGKYMKMVSSPEYQKKLKLDSIQAEIKALDKNDPNYNKNLQELMKEAKGNMLTSEEMLTLKSLALTPKEQTTLKDVKGELEDILGPNFVNMKMSKKDEYNMLVKPKEVYWYQAQGKFNQTKLLKEEVTCKINLGVNELYNGIVQLQEGYDVRKKLYDKQVKEYDQMIIRKKIGDASEIERMVAETELKKSKLQLDEMQRQIDNYKIKLKQTIGMSMTQDIELTDNNTDADKILDVKDYDVYLKNALSNRIEIKNAKTDLDVAQWEFDKMQDYFYDDDLEYKEILQTIDEAQIVLEDAKNDIPKNIEFAYMDVMQKRHDIELSRQKLDEMNTQYEAVYNGYKQGVKPLSLTWTVEVGKAKAQLDLKLAIMNYNNAVLKLESASNIGPKYETREAAKQ